LARLITQLDHCELRGDTKQMEIKRVGLQNSMMLFRQGFGGQGGPAKREGFTHEDHHERFANFN
jgi:hypothetical protein